jgi:hypothetical protein
LPGNPARPGWAAVPPDWASASLFGTCIAWGARPHRRDPALEAAIGILGVRNRFIVGKWFLTPEGAWFFTTGAIPRSGQNCTLRGMVRNPCETGNKPWGGWLICTAFCTETSSGCYLVLNHAPYGASQQTQLLILVEERSMFRERLRMTRSLRFPLGLSHAASCCADVFWRSSSGGSLSSSHPSVVGNGTPEIYRASPGGTARYGTPDRSSTAACGPAALESSCGAAPVASAPRS